MASTIYYFSGTGNSLYVARAIAGYTGECKVINIAGLINVPGPANDDDCIGFVFPVHFGSLPAVVEHFAAKARFARPAYIFAIATSGAGMPGNALTGLDRILRKNGASGLSAGFVLDMPDNAYTGMNMITPPEQRAAILDKAEHRLSEIIAVIKGREKPGITGKNVTAGKIVMPLMRVVMTRGIKVQRGFRVTDQCSGCGACEKICPVGNISADGGSVMWGDRCTLCLACFHWCPSQAIQLDSKTAGIARYTHPQVTLQDMLVRQ